MTALLSLKLLLSISQNISSKRWLQGYLCYKTITSQNALSEAQVEIFFVSWESYVSFSRYSSFCIFNDLMIYQICDIMMSINTWDRVHFWIYILHRNSLSQQTWSIDISKVYSFLKLFEQFRGLGLSSRSFSI